MASPPPPYPSQYRPSGEVIYVNRGTNGLAVAALVLGLCGFAILPVILGHVALRQIDRSGQSGYGLAIAGLVLGYLQILVYLLLFILLAGGALAIFSTS